MTNLYIAETNGRCGQNCSWMLLWRPQNLLYWGLN